MTEKLDCIGLSCPMPIVQLTKQVKKMEPGETLEVTADDLAFKMDVEAWSRKTGHAILEFNEDESVQRAVIRVG